MSNFVSHQSQSLYAADGGRKYLNQTERERVLATAASLPEEQTLFLLTLAWTGARVSEVLALSRRSFQVERGVVSIATLKRRRHHVREVPLPFHLIEGLHVHFDLAMPSTHPLWPWHRSTAWRIVKKVMTICDVAGRPACPRGFRHGFGVETLQSGVPLNLVRRWLGHSRLSTTAIYAEASGPEERALAKLFWQRERLSRTAELDFD